MTEAKYLEDAYTTVFSAKVTRVEPYQEAVGIWLDQTYFYPEGGGQPSDKGLICAFEIEDVQKQDGDIIHLTSKSNLEAAMACLNQTTECTIDFKRRLTMMQQHTGQHILSACAYNLFESKTVGLHVGDDYVTVDLDQKLSDEALLTLENTANDVVFQNRPIRVHYPDDETLRAMPLRKTPKVTKDIRVIEIEGIDFSPCGGTHFARTSQVGLIKIKKVTPYKSGIRIEFGCGYYALGFMQHRNTIFNHMIQQFSATDDTLLSRVDQTLDALKNAQQHTAELEQELIGFKAQQIFDSAEVVRGVHLCAISDKNLTMKQLQAQAGALTSFASCVILVSSEHEGQVQFVLSRSADLTQIDLKAVFGTVLKPLGVRGGGSIQAVQGAVSENVWSDTLISELKQEIVAKL